MNDTGCQEAIEISGADFEKADLESCEKERLTLPIASASTSLMSSIVVPRSSPSPLGSALCTYREECINFKKRLFLPGNSRMT